MFLFYILSCSSLKLFPLEITSFVSVANVYIKRANNRFIDEMATTSSEIIVMLCRFKQKKCVAFQVSINPGICQDITLSSKLYYMVNGDIP